MRLNSLPPARVAWLFFALFLIVVQWPASAKLAARPAASQTQADYEALADFDIRALRPRHIVDIEQKKRLLATPEAQSL